MALTQFPIKQIPINNQRREFRCSIQRIKNYIYICHYFFIDGIVKLNTTNDEIKYITFENLITCSDMSCYRWLLVKNYKLYSNPIIVIT